MKKGKIDGNARNAWWAKFTGLLSLLSAISFIIAGAPHADAEKFTSGTEQAPLTPTLKTGDYVWKPAVSPAGPVVIIVSVPEQTLYVYRNGVRIGRSTVSTGKSGHRTPTGVFTPRILRKPPTYKPKLVLQQTRRFFRERCELARPRSSPRRGLECNGAQSKLIVRSFVLPARHPSHWSNRVKRCDSRRLVAIEFQ